MFNDRSTPLSLLATRRSGKPRDLAAPGPDMAQLEEMCAIAARTPDHGKLAPWRFVIVAPERIAGFVFIGTPGRPLDERPRPDPAAVIGHWGG